MWTYNTMVSSDELYHYGIPGMRWGHRKAQLRDAIGRTGRRIRGSKAYAKGIEVGRKAYAKGAEVGRKAANTKVAKQYYNKKRAANNTSYVKSVGKGVARGIGINAGMLGATALGTAALVRGADMTKVMKGMKVAATIGNIASTANAVATLADVGMTYVNRKHATPQRRR